MNSESERPPEQIPDEPRDYTKVIWGGIVLLFVAMAGLLVIGTPSDESAARTRARAKHILLTFDRSDPTTLSRAMDTAEALRDRIRAGENFSALAREYSDDEVTGPRGGDIGWVYKGDLTENVEDYVWTAPLNEVSDVIVSNFGLHLVVVTDRELSAQEQFDREIRERVLGGGQQDAQ